MPLVIKTTKRVRIFRIPISKLEVNKQFELKMPPHTKRITSILVLTTA
ncbi:MAG: hypothetical protein MUF42_12160 [Cytophagaceae bacterium]|jgi:hypothetical protein|nr:hypothetical protein [Cytophagaceae bacterium]